MRRLRISAIAYLNTAPLMWDFNHGDAGKSFDISYTLPSLCASALRQGSADIGIIPAAAYTQIPDLAIIPDIAIASRKRVRSILLVTKKPLAEVRSVAMDTSSMTSVALTKVLFSKRWRAEPTFQACDPNLDAMLARHDAALLIGDPALQVDRSRYLAYDLAEEWFRFTGKPFVFAFWAIRKHSLSPSSMQPVELVRIFQQSRDHGLTSPSIDHIARDWSPRLSTSEDEVRSYLTENIFYHLDAACLEGLQLFYTYASECGALSLAPPLDFLDAAKPAYI